MNLQVFCDPKMDEKARYFLAKPWIRGGWQYATDGKIVVRIPADGQPDTEGRKLPQIPLMIYRWIVEQDRSGMTP